MRHRKKGRSLGRSPSHRKAMLRNLACSLILTERDAEDDENTPRVKGRVVTTLQKAKEVRPLVEKCVTIARHSLQAEQAAEPLAAGSPRGSESWRNWRTSQEWQEWNAAIAPAVAARRRALRLLGNKEAVQVLFEQVAPRLEDRNGGYTRVVRLAMARLGDGGARAILEFVGRRDRKKVKSERPVFDDTELADQTTTVESSETAPPSEAVTSTPESPEAEPPEQDGSDSTPPPADSASEDARVQSADESVPSPGPGDEFPSDKKNPD